MMSFLDSLKIYMCAETSNLRDMTSLVKSNLKFDFISLINEIGNHDHRPQFNLRLR